VPPNTPASDTPAKPKMIEGTVTGTNGLVQTANAEMKELVERVKTRDWRLWVIFTNDSCVVCRNCWMGEGMVEGRGGLYPDENWMLL